MKKIKLTQGKFALVSDQDYARLSKFKWCASSESREGLFYAVRRARVSEVKKWGTTKIRMHHFIFDTPPKTLVGRYRVVHKNGKGLDNRRTNVTFKETGD